MVQIAKALKKDLEQPTVSSPTCTALLCDDDEATKRYVEGFAGRVAAREKEFATQAKAQRWTKAADDFEYNI